MFTDSHKSTNIQETKRKKSGISRAGISKDYLTVPKTAKLLGVDEKTVWRWCESGDLLATSRQYGSKTQYLISPQAIRLFHEQRRLPDLKLLMPSSNKVIANVCHKELLPKWKIAMEAGLIGGKPFSPYTVDDYMGDMGGFLESHKVLSIQTVRDAFLSIPSGKYGRRFNLYKAIVCFAKFLIQEQCLSDEFLIELKPFVPKRSQPPKRETVDGNELKALLAVCSTLEQKALVMLVSSTGLRASEFCNVQVQDVDLGKGTLQVQKGKGGKSRRIGLHEQCIQVLDEYLQTHPKGKANFLFLNKQGNSMTRTDLYHRLRRLGNKAGVKVSPHALRRAFVTINANKGRPLQMLQIACGHSSIKTTMDYCRTTEEEVIEAMKGWD